MEFVEGENVDFHQVMELNEICYPDDLELIRAIDKHGLQPWDMFRTTFVEEGRTIANTSSLQLTFASARENILCGGIGGVAVDPAFRGQGLARKLIEINLDKLKDVNVVLFTGVPRMYEKFGFKEVEVHYYEVIGPADKEEETFSIEQAVLARDCGTIEALHDKMLATSAILLPMRRQEEWDYIYNIRNQPVKLYIIQQCGEIRGYFAVDYVGEAVVVSEVYVDNNIDEAMQAIISSFQQKCIVPEHIKEMLSGEIFQLTPVTSPFEHVMILERTPMADFYIPYQDMF